MMDRQIFVLIFLMILIPLNRLAFAIESIGTIGQPLPEQHATSFKDGIHLWNWQTGESIGTMVRLNSPTKRARAFSPDGRHFLIVSKQPDVELWHVE